MRCGQLKVAKNDSFSFAVGVGEPKFAPSHQLQTIHSLFRSTIQIWTQPNPSPLPSLSLACFHSLYQWLRSRFSLRSEPITNHSSNLIFQLHVMGVVIESSIWEPNPALFIFIFISCLFSIFLFPYASNNSSNKTSTLFDHGIPSSFLRFQRKFLFLYSLASGQSLLCFIYIKIIINTSIILFFYNVESYFNLDFLNKLSDFYFCPIRFRIGHLIFRCFFFCFFCKSHSNGRTVVSVWRVWANLLWC